MHTNRHTTVCVLLLAFLSTSSVEASTHRDPLAILNGRSSSHHSTRQHKHDIKRPVRWVASKRSLSSYGRMRHESLGPVHNSQAVMGGFDPNIYTLSIRLGCAIVNIVML